jgi:hypothetical protein
VVLSIARGVSDKAKAYMQEQMGNKSSIGTECNTHGKRKKSSLHSHILQKKKMNMSGSDCVVDIGRQRVDLDS